MDGGEKKNKRRIVEAAAAVLGAVPERELNAVVLNKALFYLDLIALRDLGRDVTGSAYVALHQGPVVAKYKQRLISALESAGVAEQVQVGRAKPIRLKALPESTEPLAPDELRLVDEVASFVGKLTSTKASDLSHENPGWQIAYSAGQGQGSPPLPIDMLIAMQQVLDDDPWLSEDIDDETRAVAERSSSAELEW